MKGIQNVKVSNRFAKYEFDLYRNITIVRGESGTGKTTLYDMIADHTRNKDKSGVNLSSTAPCVALTDLDWVNQLNSTHDSIIFIDEDSNYVTSEEFARAVKNSSNYYVIFNRESLHNLPYSVNEIYEIKTSGRYHSFKKAVALTEKNEYSARKTEPNNSVSAIWTEDSKAGYQFFDAVASEAGIGCESVESKSKVFSLVRDHIEDDIVIICDGAAFGSEIHRVSKLLDISSNVRLLLPESFEWLILKSGIVADVGRIIENPSDYIDGAEFFSWENFFTYLLIDRTKGTYQAYSKSKLNDVYLHEREKSAILSDLPKI